MSEVFGWLRADEKLEQLIREHDVKSVLEIGCFLGKSTIFFAGLVDKISVVDQFTMWEEGRRSGALEHSNEKFLDDFVKNIEEAGVMDKVTIFQSPSEEAHELIEDKFDLVYIDAAHNYESVKNDIQNYLPFAKKIICGDDYDNCWPDVIQAVDEAFGDKVQSAGLKEGNLWYVII